jgi:biopolymer transport protein ExbD
MAMGKFEPGGSGQPLSEINTTPLVDVMLVLLVIFIITAPLMTRAVSLDLPKSDTPTITTPKETLNVGINAKGEFFLDKQRVSSAELQAALERAAAQNKRTPIHLRAERDTRYEVVLEVMSMAHRLGLSQLAFVTDMPSKKP